MIAVWIVSAAFFLAGLFFGGIPTMKLLLYRGRAAGQIVSCRETVGQGAQPVKVTYRYQVDGVEYQGVSGWLSSGVFAPGRACAVRYALRAPQRSVYHSGGNLLNCVIGCLFMLVGLGVAALGLLLLYRFPELV